MLICLTEPYERCFNGKASDLGAGKLRGLGQQDDLRWSRPIGLDSRQVPRSEHLHEEWTCMRTTTVVYLPYCMYLNGMGLELTFTCAGTQPTIEYLGQLVTTSTYWRR